MYLYLMSLPCEVLKGLMAGRYLVPIMRPLVEEVREGRYLDGRNENAERGGHIRIALGVDIATAGVASCDVLTILAFIHLSASLESAASGTCRKDLLG